MRDLRPYQRSVILLTLVAAGLFFLYVLDYGLVDIVGILLSAGGAYNRPITHQTKGAISHVR